MFVSVIVFSSSRQSLSVNGDEPPCLSSPPPVVQRQFGLNPFHRSFGKSQLFVWNVLLNKTNCEVLKAMKTAQTWVFRLKWSIKATARSPEESWLSTSKMQLLEIN